MDPIPGQGTKTLHEKKCNQKKKKKGFLKNLKSYVSHIPSNDNTAIIITIPYICVELYTWLRIEIWIFQFALIFANSYFYLILLFKPWDDLIKPFLTKRWLTWTSLDGQYWNQIDYVLCSQRWKSSTHSAKTRLGADCDSYHELLVAKFRLKLKKVEKTIRPFRHDLNQIPYDYIV